MTPISDSRKLWWRYVRGSVAPVLLWLLFVGYLLSTLSQPRPGGGADFDRAVLREWLDESRPFRATLPELVSDYLGSALDELPPEHAGQADGARGEQEKIEKIRAHLAVLGGLTRTHQGYLPLFPTIYRMEVVFRTDQGPALAPVVWDSRLARPGLAHRLPSLEYPLLGDKDSRARLRVEYQLHAFNWQQRDQIESQQQLLRADERRLRLGGGLAVAGTALAFLWIYLVQRQERERAEARHQIDLGERLLLEEELRRQEAEHRHEEAERKLLEQRVATQAAERQALELKSQLFASIGIMAGSYAHNIKNLLVRPNDLLRRCLEADRLSPQQSHMLCEVRQTLGTVTERLQQILRTVRRDPSRSELVRVDLNAMARDIRHTWDDLAREKWKLRLTVDLSPEPLWIAGDLSHLQQTVENLLFNGRDATFEMRNHLRDQAHRARDLTPPERRRALIEAAAWKGQVTLRTRRQGDRAILEVQDNGIGMTEEVRGRCTQTHFSTKRDNALFEGNSTGMGLGLSFVLVILEHHRATLEIESEPLRGALFRVSFPLAGE